jgi:hypothetical protein
MRIKWIRKTHRYLGFLIGLQLLAWTVSGLYFSWNPIEKVRGEHLAEAPPSLFVTDTSLVPPTTALQNLRSQHPDVGAIETVHLRALLGDPVYEVVYRTEDERRYVLADARTGALRGPLSEKEAVAVAEADFTPDVPVRRVERVTAAPEGSEYRGVSLPAYRVVFDHPTDTRLYVSAPRGRVEARRNSTWRWFDWLWMLHIMDYDARSDFNHALLQAVSVFGLVTVASGFLLGGVTSPWLRGRVRRRSDGSRDADARPASGPPS